MLKIAIVSKLTPNILKSRALRYGEKGPKKYARSLYNTAPLVICHGTYSSLPKSTKTSVHFCQLRTSIIDPRIDRTVKFMMFVAFLSVLNIIIVKSPQL